MRNVSGNWKRVVTVGAALCAVALAQYNLASLGGNVNDSSGAPVADVTTRYCGFNCFGGVYPGEQRANINGNTAGGVYYTLDGSAHNDTYLSMNLPFPNPDAVNEFRLQENNLSAIYGSSGSGVVNI